MIPKAIVLWADCKSTFMVEGVTAKKHLLGDKTIVFGFGPTRSRVSSLQFWAVGIYRPPNVLARRGELSARRLAPGGRWD